MSPPEEVEERGMTVLRWRLRVAGAVGTVVVLTEDTCYKVGPSACPAETRGILGRHITDRNQTNISWILVNPASRRATSARSTSGSIQALSLVLALETTKQSHNRAVSSMRESAVI